LNNLELLAKLSCTVRGFLFVARHKLFTSLYELLRTKNDPLLIYGILGALSKIVVQSKKCPELIEHLQTEFFSVPFLKVIATFLDGEQLAIKETCFATIREITETEIGISNIYSQVPEVIAIFAEYASKNTYGQQVKSVSLHIFGTILHTRISDPQLDSKIHQSILQLAYNQYDHPVKLLLAYAKNPVEEIRFAAYHVIQMLCLHAWGVNMLLEHHGFLEFLLTRQNEASKTGKEWKFAIVKTLYEQKNVQLQQEQMKRLHFYLINGPFYVSAEAAVDVATL